MFLHEPGEDSESFTRQDLSSLNAYNSQNYSSSAPASNSPQPQPLAPHALPVAAAIQDNDHAISSAAGSPMDGPALPATASWGDQARRASKTTASSTTSPLVTSVSADQPMAKEETPQAVEQSEPKPKAPERKKKATKPSYPYFEDLPKMAFNPHLKFVFAYPPNFTEKDRWIVENMPPLFDPSEGVRRQRLKEQEAEDIRRQQTESQSEIKSEAALDIEEPADLAPGGSSQLGGEPEEHPDRTFGQRNLMSPQAIGSNTFGLGHTIGLTDDLASLGTRGLTPQNTQQQALLLQQLRLGNPPQNAANQGSSHARQPSRFFETSKSFAKQPGSILGQTHFGQSQASSSQFNFSSVQGPPPGLKTTGTPPVSGGGMFAQGHGFTQGVGYGPRDGDKFWETRGRGAADSGKRELMFPSYHQHPSTSSTTPTPGGLSFPYGSQPGALYQDTGMSQKQKKKGKKHRHANTSSSGGGVVDVADPSILQMRVGGAMSGQTGFGAGQGQAGGFPTSLHGNAYRGW
jgi:CCR4-NOT transcription complex subunit 4